MALTCVICGGTDFKKVDGQFVCQGCEASYTMEEAKQMALASQAATAAPAPVDNSKTIENYLNLAHQSRDSTNNEEAENYSNKVLELDPTNVEALLIKAEAVGWQSTLGTPRTAEVLNCYKAALAATEDPEKKAEIKEKAIEVTHDIYQALFSLCAKNFSPYPSEHDTSRLSNLYTDALNLCTSDLLSEGESIFLKNSSVAWARVVNNALCDAWRKVSADFSSSNEGHPSKYDLQRVVQRGGFINDGLKTASIMVPSEFAENMEAAKLYNQIMENIATIHEYLINAKSYEVSFSGGYKHYNLDQTLTDEAKKIRRGICAEMRAKGKDALNAAEEAQKKKEEAEKEAAHKAYWDAHKEEAEALNQEKDTLNNRYAEIKQLMAGEPNEMNGFPEVAEIQGIETTIKEKQTAKQSLGIFKKKEKDALDGEIAALNQKKADVEAALKAKREPVKAKFDALRSEWSDISKRLKEIEEELTKDRR